MSEAFQQYKNNISMIQELCPFKAEKMMEETHGDISAFPLGLARR